MNYLIQNTTNAPVYFPVIRMREGKPSSEGSVFFEGGNQITNVSEEIYTQLMRHPFYKAKIEKGELIVLNAGTSTAEAAVNTAIQAKELEYSRYVAFVKSIEASGGLAEPRLKPFLDQNGMPDLALCRKNLGDNVDPVTLGEYARRYMVEKENGMHQPRIVIPTGGTMTPRASDVQLDNLPVESASRQEPQTEDKPEDLETLSMEALKQKADELGVEYAEDMSFTRILNRVKKAIAAQR